MHVGGGGREVILMLGSDVEKRAFRGKLKSDRTGELL